VLEFDARHSRAFLQEAAMNRDQKAAVVEEIAGQLQEAQAVFAVDYRGISVSQVADLRAKLRDADTRLRIVKNSLSERAADKAGTESLKPLLEGPTALALVHGDAALAAKALNDTARALNILEFKGGLMNGDTLSADDIRSIARLPARDVLNAQLVGTIAAPLTGLARGLNALIAGVAIQLQAMADQGLVRGEGAAPEEPSGEAPAGGESEASAPEEGEAAAPEEGEAAGPEEGEAAGPDTTEPPTPDTTAQPTPDTTAQPTPDAPDSGASEGEPEPGSSGDGPEAAEQDVQDPDSEPHDAPVQPSQAEGEDVATQEDE
jgi:large subunit ribosomal protein L10